MSWPLFNHNLPTAQSTVGTYPTDPVGTTGTVIYQDGGVVYQVGAFHTKGLFAVDSANTKMMLNYRGTGAVITTADGADTWSAPKDVPRADTSDYYITSLEYDAPRDDYWIVVYRSSARHPLLYWSDNNGDGWAGAATDVGHYYHHDINIDANGNAWMGDRGSYWYMDKYTNPKVDNTKVRFNTGYGSNHSGWHTHILSNGEVFGNCGGEGGLGTRVYDINAGVLSASNTVVNGRNSDHSGINALYMRSETLGVVVMDIMTAGAVAPLTTTTVDFGEDVHSANITFGDGVYLLTAASVADNTKLLMVWCDPTDMQSWYGIHTVTLNDTQDLGSEIRRQCEHWGDGIWVIGYHTYQNPPTNTQYTLVLETFSIGGGSGGILESFKKELHKAIVRQAPDIYFRMDDELLATTVVDLGSKQYSNATQGSLTFQVPGLITTDGGTSCLFDAATDTGVLVSAVPAPTNHAHFFVLKHDGTVDVRVLASSGDADDPFNFSYYVFLADDHKLGAAVYNDGWEYSYSTAVIAADTTTICAVKIEDTGDVTFYVADAWDSKAEDVQVTDLAPTNLSVGGAWTGGSSLLKSADGVTVDYYVLIPKESFDYGALVEANGGTYIGPPGSPDLQDGELIFLVHGDDTALGGPTDLDGDGTFSWELRNSVPGTTNHIKTEVNTGRIDYSDAKFGAGSFVAPYRSSRGGIKPRDIAYWFEGHQRLNIGYQAFNYDVWFKSLWSNGFGYAGSSQGFYRRSGKYYRFGGITISVSQQPGDPTKGRISVDIGTSLGAALAGAPDALTMHWSNIPGYISGGFNHIAICRSLVTTPSTIVRTLSLGGAPLYSPADLAASEKSVWNVFINGNKAGVPVVIEREANAYTKTNILKSGQWMFGSYMYQHPGEPASRYTPPAKFDEARLIVGGSGIYKESFIPPTAPYDYG